jgi:hypothetical protein
VSAGLATSFLAHSFPRIRALAAENLYLVSMSMDHEELSSILTGMKWDDLDGAELGSLRDQVLNLFRQAQSV